MLPAEHRLKATICKLICKQDDNKSLMKKFAYYNYQTALFIY